MTGRTSRRGRLWREGRGTVHIYSYYTESDPREPSTLDSNTAGQVGGIDGVKQRRAELRPLSQSLRISSLDTASLVITNNYLSCLQWGLDCTYHGTSVKSIRDNGPVPGLKMLARR